MPKKRSWNLWPKKFREELNGIAGVTGIGGMVCTIAGMTILAGPTALIIGGIGATTMLSTVVWAGVKATPPKLQSPDTLVGSSFVISKLDNIHPPVKKLAIIGPKSAGKTTLKTNLAFEPRGNQRTQIVTAQVVTVPDSPPKYLAILDGAGERVHQQFEIAKRADFLCIILDHNGSDSETSLSTNRIKENTAFLEQVRNMFTDENLPKKSWIEILINKHDLWENSSQSNQTKFDSFCQTELQKWKGGNFATTVEMHPHSNERTGDVQRFMNILKQSI